MTILPFLTELETRFRNVIKNATKDARRNCLGEMPSSQSDDTDSVVGQKKRKVAKTSTVSKSVNDMFSRVIESLDRHEDRLIRIENKLDDLDDDVAVLRARNLKTRAGKFRGNLHGDL